MKDKELKALKAQDNWYNARIKEYRDELEKFKKMESSLKNGETPISMTSGVLQLNVYDSNSNTYISQIDIPMTPNIEDMKNTLESIYKGDWIYQRVKDLETKVEELKKDKKESMKGIKEYYRYKDLKLKK